LFFYIKNKNIKKYARKDNGIYDKIQGGKDRGAL
jgi:hypothetical protein